MNIEDKEFMEKYILNNPFEFKQGIISHCREMDKIDVYNWVAEDELKIDKLQQENKQLKEQLLVTQTNEETFRLEMEDITQTLGLDENTLFDDVKAYVMSLKDNWNKLKKFLEEWKENEEYCYLASSPIDRCRKDIYGEILDKMQELEQGSDSNE